MTQNCVRLLETSKIKCQSSMYRQKLVSQFPMSPSCNLKYLSVPSAVSYLITICHLLRAAVHRPNCCPSLDSFVRLCFSNIYLQIVVEKAKPNPNRWKMC